MDEALRLWRGRRRKLKEAQYNLGILYHNGHGVDVNYKKAFEWYEKAAKQEHAKAQYIWVSCT